MRNQKADGELYYQLMDRIEDEEREAWREALAPVLSLESQLLEGLPENKAFLYSNIIAALGEIITPRMVGLEAHAFDCGWSVSRDDLTAVVNDTGHHVSELKTEAKDLATFLAQHHLGSDSLLELIV